jgi:hypothetical protein
MRLYLIAALFLATTLHGQTTADDRKHWAEITHKFEAAPLDDDARRDARFAVAEISASHDFHVVLCKTFYEDFDASKYEHHAEIRLLYMLGVTTYQVETSKTDQEGTNLYALHTVLKGYAAILHDEPKAKDKLLDELANADAKGKLADLIAKKGCNASQK